MNRLVNSEARGQKSSMRAPLVVLLIASALPFAEAASDLVEKIDLAREANDTHAQIELLRRWLDAHPNDPDAVRELVGLWLAVPDYGLALQALNLAAPPEPGLAARTNAEVAWRRDDKIQEAVKILQGRAAEAPKDRATRLLLADYLAKAGQRKEQIAVLDSLIDEESDADLLLDRAEAKLAADDPGGALADFRKASVGGPDEQRVKNAQPGFERLEKAMEETGALGKLENGPTVSFQKAYWWLYGGLPGRSLAEALAGLKAWPDSVYGQILEARGLVATGSIDSAKARLERRVDTSAALEDGKARSGIVEADGNLSKKPGDLQALLQRASWLNDAAQYLLAMDDVESILKADPSSIPALHLAVAVSRRLANFPAATAYAQKLAGLKAPPDTLADVYAGLAEMAFEQSNLPLALDFADRSIAAKPFPSIWKLKAACHTRLGQPNEAADALKKAEKGAR